MTKRQWLETVTNEELLKNICVYCAVMHDRRCPEEVTCKDCQIEWLNAEHKKMTTLTNREYLKTLTDDELLKIIYVRCVAMNGGECPKGLSCIDCQLKFLNAEHKEDNND